MNAQEIFDTVAAHLAKQGRPAVSDAAGGCAYRGDDGAKCAVGCLILDEEYSSKMEGLLISQVAPERLRSFLPLLENLQEAHDESMTGAEVLRVLKATAERHDISPAILDTLTFPDKWA
jgi:hypothetical protein